MGVYTVASKDIASESFDGDAVVVDLGTGKYYSFSDSGSLVWEALLDGISTEAIAETTLLPLAMLENFTNALCNHGLIISYEGGASVKPSADFAEQISQTKEPLAVDVFDDLSDLFLADPIHDVAEPQGWPIVKPA